MNITKEQLEKTLQEAISGLWLRHGLMNTPIDSCEVEVGKILLSDGEQATVHIKVERLEDEF